MSTLSNVNSSRGDFYPPSVSLIAETLPEAKSLKTGVSVRYVPDESKRWFVFRASYGREDKASDIIIEDGTYVYIAKRLVHKSIKGKQKRFLESIIPNLLFVYTTDQKAEKYIRYTPSLSYLSYYYNHFVLNENQKNPPLIISCREMENFILATCNHNEHLLFVGKEKCHFKSGETVRVIDGQFKGVEGKVARVSGQQRVVLSITKVGLISTAYIPTAFLQIIEK